MDTLELLLPVRSRTRKVCVHVHTRGRAPQAPCAELYDRRLRGRRTCTCQYIGVSAHSAADEHWLPGQLVVDWDERVVRRERPSAALSVHQKRLLLPVHKMLLHLQAHRQL